MERLAFSETTIVRFWSKVDLAAGHDGCWPFTGAQNARGYGVFFVGEGEGPTNWIASRFSLVLATGPIGELYACHRCDNPPCCNPAHLFAGTQADNIADMWAKGRQPEVTGCHGELNGGALLSPADVVAIREAYSDGVPLKDIVGATPVSRAAVHKIIYGAAWKNVPGAVPGGVRKQRTKAAHARVIAAHAAGLTPKQAAAVGGISHVAALHALRRAGIDVRARSAGQ